MFAKLNQRTLDALTAIESGNVRWSTGRAGSVNFTLLLDTPSEEYPLTTAVMNEYGWQERDTIDLKGIAERFYEREGWETRDDGAVVLSAAGRAELEELRK